jgi:hypothetical protein
MSIFDIAEEVVELLNDETFQTGLGIEFTAELEVLPKFERSEFSDFVVSVVAISEEPTNETRKSYYSDNMIHVGFQKKVGKDTETSDVKTYAGYVKSIMEYLFNQDVDSGRFISIKTDPIYSIDSLDEDKKFASVIEIVYRSWYKIT